MIDFDLIAVLQKDSDLSSDVSIMDVINRCSNSIVEIGYTKYESDDPEGDANLEETLRLFRNWLRYQLAIVEGTIPRWAKDIDITTYGLGNYEEQEGCWNDLFNDIKEAFAVWAGYGEDYDDEDSDTLYEIESEAYAVLGEIIEIMKYTMY